MGRVGARGKARTRVKRKGMLGKKGDEKCQGKCSKGYSVEESKDNPFGGRATGRESRQCIGHGRSWMKKDSELLKVRQPYQGIGRKKIGSLRKTCRRLTKGGGLGVILRK